MQSVSHITIHALGR